MRKPISGDEERLGFTLEQRISWRVGSKNTSDVDFADDIALLSEDIKTATELLHLVESAAANLGLFVNVDKTKVMTPNIEDQAGDHLSLSGETIENVEDFIYLGSWIDGPERGINVRKRKAWALRSSRSDCLSLHESRYSSTAQRHGHWQEHRRNVWMGHTLRCCVWWWVSHGGIRSAAISCLGRSIKTIRQDQGQKT